MPYVGAPSGLAPNVAVVGSGAGANGHPSAWSIKPPGDDHTRQLLHCQAPICCGTVFGTLGFGGDQNSSPVVGSVSIDDMSSVYFGT